MVKYCWYMTLAAAILQKGAKGLSRVWLLCRYGWFVMVVEMLGATATMLYGLNIIMDPVHEELEMEPDAPGITKVTYLSPRALLQLQAACVCTRRCLDGQPIPVKGHTADL